MTEPALQSEKLEPCPWCPAIPEPHPEERSNRVYMIVRHADNCFLSPQLGGYQLIERGKLTAWSTRYRAPGVAPQEDTRPRAVFDAGFATPSPASSPVPPEQFCKCGLPKNDPIHSFSTEWQQMHRFMPKDRPAATSTPVEQEQGLVEALAALSHEQWSEWMRYLFGKCKTDNDGWLVIPADYVERWQHQVRSSYLELSESERDSDRKEAKRMIEVFRAVMPSHSVREAAREAAEQWFRVAQNRDFNDDAEMIATLAAIIERHCSPVPAAGGDQDDHRAGQFGCEHCNCPCTNCGPCGDRP